MEKSNHRCPACGQRVAPDTAGMRVALYTAIQAAGGTQKHLAERLGVTQQCVGQWLKRGSVSRQAAIRLERLYGVDASRLVRPEDVLMVKGMREAEGFC